MYLLDFSIQYLTNISQGSALSLTIAMYSLVNFPNGMQNDVTAQHLSLTLEPRKPLYNTTLTLKLLVELLDKF